MSAFGMWRDRHGLGNMAAYVLGQCAGRVRVAPDGFALPAHTVYPPSPSRCLLSE